MESREGVVMENENVRIELDFSVGKQGKVGPQGERGLQGVQGEKGDVGPQGPQGPQGEKGEQGPQGEKGEQGPQGPQGQSDVFDISDYNKNEGTFAVYETLNSALAAVPDILQRGGMSIKFIQFTPASNSKEYVQYRLISDTFTTDITQWEGVDKNPTIESNNLVKSKGVFLEISERSNIQKVVGNDNNYTTISFRGLIPLHKYRIYVKNRNPLVNNVSGTILFIYKGVVGNYTLVQRVEKYELPLSSYYDVEIPENIDPTYQIIINTKSDSGYLQYFITEDITETQKINSDISDLQIDIENLQYSVSYKEKFVSDIDINTIFETNLIQNEFFESSNIWKMSNATISNNKLNLSGASWGYQTLTLQKNHKYLIVCYAKLASNNNNLNNRYVYLNANGIGFTGSNEGITQMNHCCGYTPIIGIYDSNDVESKSFSFGLIRSYQDAQETGEILHAGVYDITEFSDTTYNEFYYAYKNYIESKLGVERLDDRIIYPDTLAKRTFINEMNNFAKEYGMNNTTFYNPSGVYNSNTSIGGDNNISTSADLCKMCASLLYNSKALRIGNIRASSEEPFVVNVLGKNSRTISITTGVGSLTTETSLGGKFVFGGKGGSWNGMQGMSGTATNYVILVKDKETDKNIVASFMKFDNVGNQSNAAQLKIIIDAVLNGETTLSAYAPAYAAGGIVPSGDPSAFKNLEFLTLSKDKNIQYEPFSTTKLMTFIVACEYGNMSDLITIYASDFQGGSGTQMQDGDILTLKDALAIMMMESNNTIATAVSRFIGQKILQSKFK